MNELQYDVVIVGGSLGGVAAALSAARMGASVCLLEKTKWLGGQFTAQGVCKPDDSQYTETVGSTQSYRTFRHDVRAYYRNNFCLSPEGNCQPTFNPGGAYPGFALEPRVGDAVLKQQLAALPNVHLRLNSSVTAIEVEGNDLVGLIAADASGIPTRYRASFFLDATDLGDLLPLCGERGTDWIIGAESQKETGEPDAPADAHPEWIQPITLPFALERRPFGEDHRIPQPADYEALKAQQKYTILDGYIKAMFTPGEDMWSYRQFIASANFADPAFPYDLNHDQYGQQRLSGRYDSDGNRGGRFDSDRACPAGVAGLLLLAAE